MNYVGLDVHKKFTYAVVKDDNGDMLAEDRFDNCEANFQKLLKPFAPDETKVVMESTGVWEYIYGILEKLGYKANLISESYVPPEEIKKLREVVRLRKMTLKQANQSINRLHAFLTKRGIFL